tara:strand:+ start:20595 stop:20969 length:375 start_codon:yes stop_codon:yes gene_type:complete
MNRIDFIKKMGAATLIPILPSKTNDRMDCEIMLITSEDPVVNNIRVLIHAYDMTLETVVDEYIPVLQERSDISRIDASYIQWLAISGLPDNYDKYEVSVRRNHETLWAQTYNYGLPREMTIEVL